MAVEPDTPLLKWATSDGWRGFGRLGIEGQGALAVSQVLSAYAVVSMNIKGYLARAARINAFHSQEGDISNVGHPVVQSIVINTLCIRYR
jgi:hypothetical protein